MIPNEIIRANGSSIIITTTTKESFEITPINEGFIVKDITPPVDEYFAEIIHSIKAQKGSIASARMEDVMFFDGIAKGFHFAWKKQGSNEMMTTKGKIESCIRKVLMNNLQLNLQLLPMSGRKFEYVGAAQSFTVKTASEHYEFEYRIDNDGYDFEGRRLINIFSLYKSKRIAVLELFTHENEYDTIAGLVFYNHPFIIFTESPEKETQVKMSFVNDPVLECEFL